MKYAALKDALDGLHAYDNGATDSGIHDEMLRQRVKEYLRSLPEDRRRKLLGRIGRDLYLSDGALEAGYGMESILEFARWLDDMGVIGVRGSIGNGR